MSGRIKTIFFFANGNTAVCDEDGQQMPELQEGWALLFARFLESRGYDPADVLEVNFPDGSRCRFFRLEDGGYNWGESR